MTSSIDLDIVDDDDLFNESTNGGTPYPVLLDATYPEDICDDEWCNYEWMEMPNK